MREIPLTLAQRQLETETYPPVFPRSYFSGFDWGEGGALAAAAEVLRLLGGAYIDCEREIAVGVDGILIKKFKVNGEKIHVDLKNQLQELPDS